jgi:hypothetical protein
VAGSGDGLGRAGTVVLALLVASLLLSAGWAWFGPRPIREGLGPGQPVIRVQVLNGSGEPGAAGRLAMHLREGGLHVVEVGNADRDDYYATLVVARHDDPAAALVVARFLGGPPVIRQARRAHQADVTVVLGSDRSRLRLGQ